MTQRMNRSEGFLVFRPFDKYQYKMTITAASKLRIGAYSNIIYNVAFTLLFIIPENQPLDTLSSLTFAPYSSSFSHLKNGSRAKIRRGASK